MRCINWFFQNVWVFGGKIELVRKRLCSACGLSMNGNVGISDVLSQNYLDNRHSRHSNERYTAIVFRWFFFFAVFATAIFLDDDDRDTNNNYNDVLIKT